ncbi:hypothetical protein EDD29_7166 [Actinocorallia herbida]|uniref:Tetratricopeptide repeat protein n=1 Tax=Actinocorallia herbida TaxID=58109 RepID=A0A3N1D7L3_9ACTN|nr:hypothetical protein [Actinocorallia herbida]ROO89471.1 hypothetical protein EDD29_7166 [Actinocorallia herbida]
MTVEEIARALEGTGALRGRQRLERLERLAEHARACPSRALEADVLIALAQAHEYSAERARLPVVIGRLLQLLDAHGAELPGLDRNVYWNLKWMTSALINNPAVPVPTVLRWMDELERRYRERGISLRPAHGLRGHLAQMGGDEEAAARHFEASVAAVRDEYADCHACENNALGDWRAWLGDDTGALRYWAPLLDGELTCASEPHATLGQALLPLVRGGRAEEARSAHLRGYPMVRRAENLRGPVGCHIEFCALTGNEGRGLEILAEHAEWLTFRGEDARPRLEFLTGALVLLRRLAVLGLADLPLADGTVGSVLAEAEPETHGLAGRFDARFGGDRWARGLAARLAAAPLLESLPLGTRTRLPAPVPDPAPVPAVGADLDALVAEARRMSDLRHPRTDAAWERVAALPHGPEIALEVRMQRAKSAGTVAAVADLLPDLEDRPALRAEALAVLSVALVRGGDLAGGTEAAGEAAATAEALWSDGVLTPEQYLAARRAVPFAVLNAIDLADPATGAHALHVLVRETALAEDLGVPSRVAQYLEMSGRVHAGLGDVAEALPYVEAAREGYLKAGQPWFLAGPAHLLAQVALEEDDAARAEARVAEALRLGRAALGPEDLARTASLLVECLLRQEGRETDAIAAALDAAHLWEGVHEPDHVHNICHAARAYLRLDRPGEAVGLFEQVADRFEVSYEEMSLALTRRQYGEVLRRTGDHRRAAEQYLAAAAVAAAMEGQAELEGDLAWYAAEELDNAGLRPESLAAYRRAAALWRDLGAFDARVRCLRAAAWAELALDEGPEPGAPEAAGPAAMSAVLAEVEARAAAEPSPELDELLADTRGQLAAMLTIPEGEAG